MNKQSQYVSVRKIAEQEASQCVCERECERKKDSASRKQVTVPAHAADTVSVSKIPGEREESEETGEFVHAGPCWAVVGGETAGGANDCAAPAGRSNIEEESASAACKSVCV